MTRLTSSSKGIFARVHFLPGGFSKWITDDTSNRQGQDHLRSKRLCDAGRYHYGRRFAGRDLDI